MDPSDASDARDRVCALARAHVGLVWPAKAYETWLFPYDAPASAHQMAQKLSSCGLACEALLRGASIDDDRLYEPYGPRTVGHGLPAISMQRDLAEKMGAWVDTTTWTPGSPLPQPGDMLQQGGGADGDPAWFHGRGFNHVFTVVDAPDDTDAFSSVDGGQPGILLKSKVFVEAAGQLWVCAPGTSKRSDGTPSTGARIAGYINLGALRLRTPVDTGAVPAADPTDPSESV